MKRYGRFRAWSIRRSVVDLYFFWRLFLRPSRWSLDSLDASCFTAVLRGWFFDWSDWAFAELQTNRKETS